MEKKSFLKAILLVVMTTLAACTTDGENVRADNRPVGDDRVKNTTAASVTDDYGIVNTDEDTDRPETYKADNSGINERDAATSELTAADQGNSEKDVATTRAIRRALTNSSTLSTYAQNVKIITIDGHVTLKGPVKSQAEKNAVMKVAQRVVGAKSMIHNEIEIAK